MHKKGVLGEQMMFFSFIFLMGVVGAGIVIGVYMFVGAEFDFRGSDANMLSYRLKNCISDLDSPQIEGIKGDGGNILLYSLCGLNKEVVEKYNKIKICRGETNSMDCIGEQDSGKIVFSSGGDFEPCGFEKESRLLGCSVADFEEYTIIATSKQGIRRNIK